MVAASPHTRYSNYKSPALIWSAILHFIIFLLVLVGLPKAWEAHRESLPTAMRVEILPVGQTNVKPKEQSKADKTKKTEPATSKKATSASKSNQAKPKVKKDAIPLPDKKKEKPKKKPKPKEKEIVKKEDDLSAILKSVADAAKKEEGDKTTKSNANQKKAISDNYNPSLPMAMSEIDAIRSQFVQCWNVPAGAKDAHNLRITVDVRLQPNGNVISVDLASINKGRYGRDSFFRAAADSAMRAVRRCSPLKNLPSKKYDTWRYLQLTFDPRDMLY